MALIYWNSYVDTFSILGPIPAVDLGDGDDEDEDAEDIEEVQTYGPTL